MYLQLPQRRLELSTPLVMGILNLTPDSFSDGGAYATVDQALARVAQMLAEGATIIDVGGESTRPGAVPVTVEEELARVLPVIARIRAEFDCVVSIDTMKPAVMRAACAAGAEIINDVAALRADGALQAAQECGAAVILMHMHGEPRTMQEAPAYRDVCAEVAAFLQARAAACRDIGIAAERLVFDPGFGFGKTLAHNLELFAGLRDLAALGPPLLLGVSRKSLFGQLLGTPVQNRLAPSVAAAALAVAEGVSIVRAHDVRATADAIHFAAAVGKCRRLRSVAPNPITIARDGGAG